MQEALTAQLCQCHIFEGLSPAQIQKILPCIHYSVRTYNSQERIYNKGDAVRDLGVVLEGEVALCDEAGGKHTTVGSVSRNGLIGEEAAFSSSGGLPHQVIAPKGAQVLHISVGFFLQACGKSCDYRDIHQEVVRNMLRLLSDRAILLGKKIAYLTANDLKMKIAMYLRDLYEACGSLEFTMPLNRDRLAEFFSVARPSLSRELTGLRNLGIIDFRRSSVTILDLDALYHLAQGLGTGAAPELLQGKTIHGGTA